MVALTPAAMSPLSRSSLGVLSLVPTLTGLAISGLSALSREAFVETVSAIPTAGIVAFAVAMLVGIAVVLGFAVHAVGRQDLTGVGRLGWVLALTACGMVTAPLYWGLTFARGPEPYAAVV